MARAESQKLTKPGPAASALRTNDASSTSTSFSATSLGLRRKTRAFASATFVAKSPCSGSLGRSTCTPSSSTPYAFLTASRTAPASRSSKLIRRPFRGARLGADGSPARGARSPPGRDRGAPRTRPPHEPLPATTRAARRSSASHPGTLGVRPSRLRTYLFASAYTFVCYRFVDQSALRPPADRLLYQWYF